MVHSDNETMVVAIFAMLSPFIVLKLIEYAIRILIAVHVAFFKIDEYVTNLIDNYGKGK